MSSAFTSISEYRKYTLQSTRYSYSQYGHIFAPSIHRDEDESQLRDRLDEYMRYLYLAPFGAALLQAEVQGNRAIDEAIVDGRVYEMQGIWATRVQTETFSYYSTDPKAEGQREWLPFFLDETYCDRQGQLKQKSNQKALNLAFKKPLEGEVVAEVEERFQRWLAPVLDMFRRHWECRETVEGSMVMALYFEYVGNIQRVLQQYSGEDKLELRADKIQTLMDQYLLDTEEVRLTAPQRHYTSTDIIAAARCAIHNFCVDQNRRIAELLGSKKTVSMFLEGRPSPVVVYHTNRNPYDWRSPMLNTQELVVMAERCFILLAENDQLRSKMRMDEKASTTYAPVIHAETQRARVEMQTVAEAEEDFDDRPEEKLPFGLSFESNETEEIEFAGLTLIDILVGKGKIPVPYAPVDLSEIPYAICVKGDDELKVIHRMMTLEDAIDAIRKTQAQAQADQIEALRAKVKLLYDPQGALGAEGSTRLLRTLNDGHKRDVVAQGDRYWAAWAVVEQVREDSSSKVQAINVRHRFISAADAAVYLKRTLDQLKAQAKVAQFKQEAALLKLVQDPGGYLGASGASRTLEGLPQEVLSQLKSLHYEVKRCKVVITVPHLDEESVNQVNTAVAAEILARAQQAKQRS